MTYKEELLREIYKRIKETNREEAILIILSELYESGFNEGFDLGYTKGSQDEFKLTNISKYPHNY